MVKKVPFSIPIDTTGYDRSIRIHGSVPFKAKQFSINLQHGPGFEAENINMHFNARFKQNEVVRNHREWGTWGIEEKKQTHFPFREGQGFEIEVVIDHRFFQVSILCTRINFQF